jgi:hypothetical protein
MPEGCGLRQHHGAERGDEGGDSCGSTPSTDHELTPFLRRRTMYGGSNASTTTAMATSASASSLVPGPDASEVGSGSAATTLAAWPADPTSDVPDAAAPPEVLLPAFVDPEAAPVTVDAPDNPADPADPVPAVPVVPVVPVVPTDAVPVWVFDVSPGATGPVVSFPLAQGPAPDLSQDGGCGATSAR